MPTYKVERVRSFKMNETLAIRAASPEAAVLAAHVQVTPLDVRRLYEERNAMYLVRLMKISDD